MSTQGLEWKRGGDRGPSDSFLQAVRLAISCCFISRSVEVIRRANRECRWRAGLTCYLHFSNHTAPNLHTDCRNCCILWQYGQTFNLLVSVGPVVQYPPPRGYSKYEIISDLKLISIAFRMHLLLYFYSKLSVGALHKPPTSKSVRKSSTLTGRTLEQAQAHMVGDPPADGGWW